MTPWVRWLITANVVMFLLTMVMPDLMKPLELIPALVLQRPWTLVTYAFLHAGFAHILFNMLTLFFFGPQLEARIGGTNFIRLYLFSALSGAVASFVTPFAAIVGASGAIFGVMLGFARYWPRATILIWGIVPVQARIMVIIMTVLSLFGGMGIGQAGIAHFAHLGGFAGGWLYLKWMERRRFVMAVAPREPRRSFGGGVAAATIERWKRIPLDALHPANREEVGRVLTKLEQHGPASLTADERETLNRFSAG
ncbi:MAG TPA: rhomboid family intramembrane serine protease [Gemmatimonadales bacterium]|nr:rhomboid family intramembrane serine protease [Gemmatimonadales bacterium]